MKTEKTVKYMLIMTLIPFICMLFLCSCSEEEKQNEYEKDIDELLEDYSDLDIRIDGYINGSFADDMDYSRCHKLIKFYKKYADGDDFSKLCDIDECLENLNDMQLEVDGKRLVELSDSDITAEDIREFKKQDAKCLKEIYDMYSDYFGCINETYSLEEKYQEGEDKYIEYDYVHTRPGFIKKDEEGSLKVSNIEPVIEIYFEEKREYYKRNTASSSLYVTTAYNYGDWEEEQKWQLEDEDSFSYCGYCTLKKEDGSFSYVYEIYGEDIEGTFSIDEDKITFTFKKGDGLGHKKVTLKKDK